MSDADPHNESTFRICTIKSDLRETETPKQAILRELERHGFCDDAIFGLKLAMEEAFTNAIKHGNRCDASKTVTVRYAVSVEMVAIIVRDEGNGFIPDDVPDPTSPDRLPVPSGRGIMLLRAYMDKVEYRDHGRELYFMKRRT